MTYKSLQPPVVRASIEANLRHTQTLTERFPSSQSPTAAIRRKCLDCCVGDMAEVDRCHIMDCALWPFRYGKDPQKGWGRKRDAGSE